MNGQLGRPGSFLWHNSFFTGDQTVHDTFFAWPAGSTVQLRGLLPCTLLLYQPHAVSSLSDSVLICCISKHKSHILHLFVLGPSLVLPLFLCSSLSPVGDNTSYMMTCADLSPSVGNAGICDGPAGNCCLLIG